MLKVKQMCFLNNFYLKFRIRNFPTLVFFQNKQFENFSSSANFLSLFHFSGDIIIPLHSSPLTIAFFFNIPKSCTFSRKLLCAVRIFALSTSFFNSSMSLLSFALLFWNHVMTCALLRLSDEAISSLSAGLRYFWYRKRFSSSKIWWFVKAVRDFRFFFGCCRLLKRFRWFWPSRKEMPC